MMAAATPAMTPEVRAVPILVPSEAVARSIPEAAQILSWALPWTANLAMV